MRTHLLTLATMAAALFATQSPAPKNWTYAGPEGPDHWSELSPAYAACNHGRRQSPIDIDSGAAHHPVLPILRFDSHPAPLQYLIDNTHAIRVNFHPSGDFLVSGSQHYQLTQLHFHHPSEESFDGKFATMDIHIMLETADGKLGGIAVQIVSGHANPVLQPLLDHLPATLNQEFAVTGATLDPAALLPQNLSAYYRYTGSLTGPPCTEGVTWFVLKTPIELSPAQIEQFARVYSHNVRPIQPSNGRTIESTP